ncbi:MAG: DinB family protein [Chloroflexi bacterium]|nr:DinB family protein [Chloroflexota bacterium]MCI0649867.1 DinB family protein [Chloroflexota bacterium]
MAEDRTTLEIFYGEWRKNQDNLKAALAPLTPEQLRLRPAADLLSVGQLAQHIVAVRVYWFHGLLGEGGPDVADYALWDEPDAPPRTAAELLAGLDASWQLMARALARWTPADRQQTFPYERDGNIEQLSRSWVIWHVLEQNLHHVGEITVTLRTYNLPAPDL